MTAGSQMMLYPYTLGLLYLRCGYYCARFFAAAA